MEHGIAEAERVETPVRSRADRNTERARAGTQRVVAGLVADWTGSKLITYGVGVTLLACAVVVMSFINRPTPYLPYHDSREYIVSAHRIMAGGTWADPQRLPGYPLFLAIVFSLAGGTNLVAAEGVQLALFVLTTFEVYVLAYRVWRRTGIAALIAALTGSNVYFLEFVKPILSDGLALWLVTSLALAVVFFIERPRAWRFWLVATLTLVLIMTRAEWYLAPLPLFGYLLFAAYQRRRALRLLPHMLAALALLYAVIIGYIALNAHVNSVAQLTADENVNLYGKVTQYNMQSEAPPQFAGITHVTEHFVTGKHERDPWVIYWADPWIGRNHFAEMGAYARAIIKHHPIEYLRDSAPVAVTSLFDHYEFGRINVQRRAAKPLRVLLAASMIAYGLFLLFPVCAAWWLLNLLFMRRKRCRRRTELVGAVLLLALYDLTVTTLGSYDEYARLHVGFDPLMLIVVVGSIPLLVNSLRHRRSGDVIPRISFPWQSQSAAHAQPDQSAA